MKTLTIDETFKVPVSIEDIDRTKSHVFTVSNDDDYVAVVPEPLAEDFNLGWATLFDAVAWIVFVQGNHISGNNWKLEKPLEFARVLWKELGNIPVNDDNEIEQSFLHFEIGTDTDNIWQWFESNFDLSVATELMYTQ
jgi:hypothetical protein